VRRDGDHEEYLDDVSSLTLGVLSGVAGRGERSQDAITESALGDRRSRPRRVEIRR
jgi:hypothetical protein